MFSSILTIFKQINHLQYSHCVNNIYFNNNQYSYCQKSSQLNNVKVQNDIVLANKNNNVNLYIYANRTQQATIESQVFNYNIKTFAIFGFNNCQEIHDSQINMSLKFDVLQGALICIQCDVFIHNCTLVFVARGQQVSGVLIESLTNIQIIQSFVQYRHTSGNSSGVVNIINNAMDNFTVAHCKLAGHNIITSPFNGYITSAVLTHVVVNVTDFYVCAGDTVMLGQLSVAITQNGSEVERCDICGSLYYVYGLCVDSIQYGTLANGTMQCVYPFEYANDKCECAYGHLRNGSACISLIDAIENLLNTETLLNNISSQFKAANQNLVSNISALDQRIQNNVTQLLDMMKQNLSALEQYILSNFSKSEQFLISNATALDNRIRDNISTTNQTIYDSQSNFDTQIHSKYIMYEQIINQNTSILNKRITDNISEVSNYLNTSTISIENNILSNITQIESLLHQNILLLNQKLNDNCTQVQSNMEIITINLKNSLLDNTTELDQRIYNNISALNTSVVKSISELEQISSYQQSNITVLNQKLQDKITEYDFKTTNIQAKIYNLSIILSCLNNNGHVLGENCYVLRKIIDQNKQMKCEQQTFFYVFNIQTVTVSLDVTNGSHFSNINVLKNSFIDIQDNVFTSDQPLFKNQNSFTNIKIQFGTQLLSKVSMITNSQTLSINQLIVKSKISTQLETSEYINILSPTVTNATISNLLVNLSFKMSQGNITLINNINGVLNVTNYHILGFYQSSKTVAMIGLYITSTQVNINFLSFSPKLYNIGNYSSFLMSFISQCNIKSTNIAIFMGDIINSSMLTEIYSIQSNQFQFGGLITNITDSTLSISNIIVDSYHNFVTQYIQFSGILIGFASSQIFLIQIQNMCMQQYIKSSTSFLQNFGVIGQNSANILFSNSTIILNISAISSTNCGIVGFQSDNDLKNKFYAQVFNTISTLIQNSEGQNIGAFFGKLVGNVTIINGISTDCNINSQMNVGGFIGCLVGSNSNIEQLKYINNNISVIWQQVGGIIGISQLSNLTIINVNIIDNNISGNRASGFMSRSEQSNFEVSNTNITNNKICANDLASGFASLSIITSKYQVCKIYVYNNTMYSISSNSGGFGCIFDTSEASITDSIFQNDIKTDSSVGGIISKIYESNIILSNLILYNCNILAQTLYSGGLLGQLCNSKFTVQNLFIENCSISASQFVGSILGDLQGSSQMIVTDTKVQNNNIKAIYYAGGLCGQCNSDSKFINLSLYNINISAKEYAGGIIGRIQLQIYIATNIQVENTLINLCSITSLQKFGIIIGHGDLNNQILVINSNSKNNYVNMILIADCPNLTNNISVNQCT
ncbi:Conserved_hypothetical protein [Hexamita inflata]|uniref:Transmembrane protein n=1 Tax=Hexamita inflata TaxID=28002 RepID=A0ABP1GGX5_9EUKA